MRVLLQLSPKLYRRVRAVSHACDSVPIINCQGDVLARLDLGSEEKYDFSALRMKREDLRAILLDEAAQHGAHIYHQRDVFEVLDVGRHNADSRQGDPIALVSSNSLNLGRHDFSAEIIIGADGIHSRTRDALGYPAGPKYQGMAAIIGFTPRTTMGEWKGQLPCAIKGREGMFYVGPASANTDELIFFSTLPIENQSKEEWRTLGKDGNKLRRILADYFVHSEDGWPEVVRRLIIGTPGSKYMLYPFNTVSAKTMLHEGKRVILIGDAAHAMPPSAGQGGAMALEDAITLGEAIAIGWSAEGEKDDDLLDDSLTRWQLHRLQRIERVLERTERKTEENKGGEKKSDNSNVGEQEQLDWLYGYDGVEEMRTVLADRMEVVESMRM